MIIHTKNTAVKQLILLTFSMVLSACGLSVLQKQQVTDFSEATIIISNSTIDQFKSYREKIIELERQTIIMQNTSPPKELDLDGGLNIKDLGIRIATVKALKKYAAILKALSSNSQTDDITKAMNEFISQLESIEKNSKQPLFFGDKKHTFSKIVAIAASWSLEKVKAKQIKIIVNSYAPVISSFSSLLKNDLVLKESSLCIKKKKRSKTRLIKTGIIDHYCTSAKKLLQISSIKLKNRKLSFSEREFAYDSYILGISSVDEAVLLSKQGNKSIKKLAQANESLVIVLNNDKVEKQDVKEFAKEVTELQSLIDILTKI